MAISTSRYNSAHHDYVNNNKLQQELRSFFSYAIEGNEKLTQLEGVKTTIEWYKQQKDHREKVNEEDGNQASVIFSTVANKMIETLLDKVQPYYTDSIIKAIGIKTQYRQGSVEVNFEIGYIPIKPYVEYVKLHNQQRVSSVKFVFQLDTNTTIEKLKIPTTSKEHNKSIDIKKIGIGLELSLIEVRISTSHMPLPFISFNGKLKLAKKEFEMNDLSFPYFQHSNGHVENNPINNSSKSNYPINNSSNTKYESSKQ
jgi:hypothetical protein